MSRLSDVLGGVYRDDDPTPDQHDSAALDVAPDVDEETETAAVWALDDDDDTAPSEDAAASGDDPVETAPVWDLQSVVDDPTSDWETAVVGEPASDWDEPASVDVDPSRNAGPSNWLDDLADDGSAEDDPAWDLEAPADDAVRFETAEPVEEPQPEAITETVAEPEPIDPAPAADDDRIERSITAASFGLLSAEDAPEGELDITDGGPWLRTDDDILPAKAKRGLAFWRR